MYNLNRLGPSRPMCSRQFVTMGLHAETAPPLKPEYLGNEHLRFLNNFGLSRQLIADKTFVDINSRVKPSGRPSQNSSCVPAAKPEMPRKENGPCRESGDGEAEPQKSKERSKSPKEDGPKKCKKSAPRQKRQKQSKRESDRCVIGRANRKQEGKLWHKRSLKQELLEVDDLYALKSTDLDLDKEPSTVAAETCTSFESTKAERPTLGPRNFPRQPSECESEDSFIVFEENSNCFDSDDQRFSDDDDEDSGSEVDFEDGESCSCAVDNISKKKVRFAPGKDLCEVHPMVKWSFAYQRARKGPWEQCAVDRMRFANRISAAESVLADVLEPTYRVKVYDERFRCD